MTTHHRETAKAAALTGIQSVETAAIPLRVVIVDGALSFSVTVSWVNSANKLYAATFTIDDTALVSNDVYRRIQLAATRIATAITGVATRAPYLISSAGATPIGVSTGEVQ